MIDAQILTFTGIVLLLTLTPGADTMLVLRCALGRGAKAGILAALGICLGLFFHATLSALGLSVILVKSALAFEVVKYAGAAYLIYLGGQSLWQVYRQAQTPDVASLQDERGEISSAGLRPFWDGLLTDVLNPKVAVFYLAFLPQFIRPGEPVLAKSLFLAGIHGVLGLIWLSLIALFVGRIRPLFADARLRRGLEATAATVLILFGVRLAMERR